MKSLRVMLTGGLAIALLAASAPSGVAAKCTDEQAVIDARNMVAMTCDCAGSTNHGQFVKCAKGVANGDTNLPKSCKGAVIKCAAHSACGKIANGGVTCCITSHGKTKCKVSTTEKCAKKHGVPGGTDGMHTSCCSNTHPLTTDSCTASPSGAFVGSAAF
jgi:hypothetical protein